MGIPIEVRGEQTARREEVLNDTSTALVAELEAELGPLRAELLDRRQQLQAEFAQGKRPTFAGSTAHIRSGAWRVRPAPADLMDRRVEITGPTDAKMIINALNSGARVFMADFEDANSPTFANMVNGQLNILEAIAGHLNYTSPEGRLYQLADTVATLMPRPRGWHLAEKHVQIDGASIAGAL